MRMEVFVKRSRLEAPPGRVFDWHTRPGAFERLTPPWEPVRVLERSGGVEEGARVTLLTHVGPFRRRWVAEHYGVVAGMEFRDRQVSGPFRSWDHAHRVEPVGPGAAVLEDRIEYALPLGLGASYVRRRLERLFEYRHRTTARDLDTHHDCPPTDLWIRGASGFLGSALVPFLTAGGHAVETLARDAALPEPPARPYAVVHLAGENIGSGRWTAEKKRRIRDSRVEGTRRLAEGLAALPRRPEVLVCASAVGLYGDRGDEILTEESARGPGFLADVCAEWEAAAAPASRAGIRVVHLRFGIILSPDGGALRRMLLPFQMGVGGRIGGGGQYMSWITRDDAIDAIHHAVATPELRGPVNAVAPEPVTNREFTRDLAGVLGRPAVLPMPAFAARLAFGETADALLLSSQRAVPRKLLASGYRFRHPHLRGALREILGAS